MRKAYRQKNYTQDSGQAFLTRQASETAAQPAEGINEACTQSPHTGSDPNLDTQTAHMYTIVYMHVHVNVYFGVNT